MAYGKGIWEGVFAVSQTIRTRARYFDYPQVDLGAGEYTLSGIPTGHGYFTPFQPLSAFSVYDGTSDGTYNYFVDHNGAGDLDGGGVYRTDYYWQNPQLLFYPRLLCPPWLEFGCQYLSGIAYDPTNNSLWISSKGSRWIADYSLDGVLLAAFDASPYWPNVGLGLDPADHTLWLTTGGQNVLRQYSLDGATFGKLLQVGLPDGLPSVGENPGEFQVLVRTDFTPPVTTASASPGQNTNGWNTTNVTVTLNATDNPGGSGVKQIQFALGGSENTVWQKVVGNAASVTISAEGTTVLSYFATDTAWNQETAKTLTVRIDKTPPVIVGLPAPGCTIWPPNHKLVQIATVTAADALSRLAPGSFNVTGTSNDPSNGQIAITGGPSRFLVQLGADKDETYTLTATARDLAGNVATSTATCTVPHDQGH
jgi:hypothetical protein